MSLGLFGRAGAYVRHRDFLAEVDEFDRAPTELDRADGTFTVRRGRGNGGCVSLESVNYPGYFLRHRNFLLRLEPADGSRLFDQDSTFCAVPVRQGQALVLNSINFPSRFLVARDGGVHLDGATPDSATAFVVRPPL